MLAEVLMAIFILMGMFTVRFGLPVLVTWLFGKVLKYSQAALS